MNIFDDLFHPPVPTRHLVVDWEQYSKQADQSASLAEIWRKTYAQKREGECLSDLMARLKQR